MSAADVRLAMHGDHDAFAALVTAATTRLYALACLIIRDPDRAADATQEAFIHAWREIPRLRDADHFDAWLRRLVVNAVLWALGRDVPPGGADVTVVATYTPPETFDLSKVQE